MRRKPQGGGGRGTPGAAHRRPGPHLGTAGPGGGGFTTQPGAPGGDGTPGRGGAAHRVTRPVSVWVRRPLTRGTVTSGDVTQICVSEADAWTHVSADCPLQVCSGFAALPSVSYVRRVCPETPIACERSVLGETALKPPRGVGPHPWAPHPTPGRRAPGGGASPPSPVPRVGAAKCRPRGAPSPPALGLPSPSQARVVRPLPEGGGGEGFLHGHVSR